MQDLGRTTTLDPHAENYYSFSPYSFLNNNPINFIDPDGKDGIRIIDKKNKTIIIKAFYFVQTEQSTYYNIKGKMKKLDGYSTKDVAYM